MRRPLFDGIPFHSISSRQTKTHSCSTTLQCDDPSLTPSHIMASLLHSSARRSIFGGIPFPSIALHSVPYHPIKSEKIAPRFTVTIPPGWVPHPTSSHNITTARFSAKTPPYRHHIPPHCIPPHPIESRKQNTTPACDDPSSIHIPTSPHPILSHNTASLLLTAARVPLFDGIISHLHLHSIPFPSIPPNKTKNNRPTISARRSHPISSPITVNASAKTPP